ncbi:RimJ/RimL family protein N-acetyltransferase [Parenemella sanctibonifatiensis]|uniref:RimJ/RimL family protein N-acetyltransferase n=1 Tax=Parenemella sanctibonifatiensis TaxID=2016505 RepID=A0A255ED84_9ACTN|nr:RimJ/RimL family protein N-acetyltransferase [Parenemella sanctibonifatiensis]
MRTTARAPGGYPPTVSEHRPFPAEIRTERLVLRTPVAADAAEQAAAVMASLPELQEWMPWAKDGQTAAQAKENIASTAAEAEADREYNWVIRDAATEQFLGRISIFAIRRHVPKGEIGYWLATAATGHGYMREAVQGVVDAALAEGFHRIEIRCDPDNHRSAAVPRALGFTLDARFPNDGRAVADPSQLRDTFVFSLTT